jgi:deoxyribonuclease-4
MGHIHARGHGGLRTSEDYAELFDQARETFGGSTFYCHFAGVEHRMGNALHYTQIKKSDLKFEPFAEFLAEEGDWMDITIISDSPLLEHDAMYMLQHYDKARQRLLEIRARDERRAKLAAQTGMDPEELKRKEEEAAAARKAQLAEEQGKTTKKPVKKTAAKGS